MKYTDAKAVLELAKNIVKDSKEIAQYATDLSSELKSLQGSFLDDGIEEVNSYVNTITEKINGSQASVVTVANQLVEYANLLIAGKR